MTIFSVISVYSPLKAAVPMIAGYSHGLPTGKGSRFYNICFVSLVYNLLLAVSQVKSGPAVSVQYGRKKDRASFCWICNIQNSRYY